MHLPIKAICDPRTRKDATNLISIQYCHSPEKRTVLPVNIHIPIAYWNTKQRLISNKLPVSFGDANELNQFLLKMIRRAEDLVFLAKEMNCKDPIQILKEHFYSELSIGDVNEKVKTSQGKLRELESHNLDLYFQIDDYIKSKINKVCKDMPRIYRNMKDHLKAFEIFRGKPITFDCMDLTFYEEFVDFLSYDYVQRRRKEQIVGLKTNTVGKTIKQLRTFLGNRVRKRIIPPIDLHGWTILEVETDAVYCTRDEINLIYQLNLSKYPHLIDYRNLFVLGCLTGLRFSDFSLLMKDDLRGDMLHKMQQKSNHWVVIPLLAGARVILENHLNKNVEPLTNAEFNRHIKSIARLAGINQMIKFSFKKGKKEKVEIKPKYEWITSHTCRRSFCTNEFLAGTPVELIMKISGHKSVKDFYKYIRITPEEAAQRIKEIWLERGRYTFNNGNSLKVCV
jgi:integrase